MERGFPLEGEDDFVVTLDIKLKSRKPAEKIEAL
jgi:hypothetical protein